MDLTKSAKRSIALIYKAYLSRVENGIEKKAAAFFGAFSEETKALKGDISGDILELKSAGLISASIIGDISLKDEAIIFMENKSAETIKEWFSFIAQFIP